MNQDINQWMEDHGISFEKPSIEENYWKTWTHDNLTNEIVEGQGYNLRTALKDIAGKLGISLYGGIK